MLQTQITKLEARVNHQHTIRKEMQILFEEEKASLVEQHKRDEKNLSDMEDRLCIIRRREQDLRDEYSEVSGFGCNMSSIMGTNKEISNTAYRILVLFSLLFFLNGVILL